MKTISLKKQSAFTKNDISKVKILFRITLLVIGIVVLSLFYIWSRVEVVKMGYEIGDLIKIQKELKAQSQKLALELSVLKTPQRIEELATKKLGMDWPIAEKTFTLKKP